MEGGILRIYLFWNLYTLFQRGGKNIIYSLLFTNENVFLKDIEPTAELRLLKFSVSISLKLSEKKWEAGI
jgi:hypothetical protein